MTSEVKKTANKINITFILLRLRAVQKNEAWHCIKGVSFYLWYIWTWISADWPLHILSTITITVYVIHYSLFSSFPIQSTSYDPCLLNSVEMNLQPRSYPSPPFLLPFLLLLPLSFPPSNQLNFLEAITSRRFRWFLAQMISLSLTPSLNFRG